MSPRMVRSDEPGTHDSVTRPGKATSIAFRVTEAPQSIPDWFSGPLASSPHLWQAG